MKLSIDVKRFKFYLWVGFAYVLLWLLIDLANYPGTFLPRFFNNIWRAVYIIAINFIFFEYVLPFLRRKRKSLLYNILLALFFFQVQMLLCSIGLYVWRYIGVKLHIWTSLRTFTSIEEGV